MPHVLTHVLSTVSAIHSAAWPPIAPKFPGLKIGPVSSPPASTLPSHSTWKPLPSTWSVFALDSVVSVTLIIHDEPEPGPFGSWIVIGPVRPETRIRLRPVAAATTFAPCPVNFVTDV